MKHQNRYTMSPRPSRGSEQTLAALAGRPWVSVAMMVIIGVLVGVCVVLLRWTLALGCLIKRQRKQLQAREDADKDYETYKF